MSDLSKRLEIIRNAIALGDEDIIALQAQRLPAPPMRGRIKAAGGWLTYQQQRGAPQAEHESFDFAAVMRETHAELDALNKEAGKLAAKIQKNFKEMGL